MSKKDLYINELTSCLKEMVSEDLKAGAATPLSDIPGGCYISQLIVGDYTAFTALYAEDAVLNAFASAYAKFDVSPDDRDEILADFLNMTNGRFAVLLSNSQSVECTLSVPEYKPPGTVTLRSDSVAIPVEFPFGSICFIFSE